MISHGINKNDEVLKTEKVKEGDVPSNSYSIEDTKEWDYTVTGWAVAEG